MPARVLIILLLLAGISCAARKAEQPPGPPPAPTEIPLREEWKRCAVVSLPDELSVNCGPALGAMVIRGPKADEIAAGWMTLLTAQTFDAEPVRSPRHFTIGAKKLEGVQLRHPEVGWEPELLALSIVAGVEKRQMICRPTLRELEPWCLELFEHFAAPDVFETLRHRLAGSTGASPLRE